jgi:predicted  nucleic acid-binding Zn-ribbon protein
MNNEESEVSAEILKHQYSCFTKKNEAYNKLETKLNDLTNDYNVHKTGLNTTLQSMNNTLETMNKTLKGLIETEKEFIRVQEKCRTTQEKINTLEDKFKWVTRTFIGAILVVGVNSVYTIKKDGDLEEKLLNRLEKLEKSKTKNP